ncbi:MAG: fibronectin type III domain-containing protein [Clostridiales Family XIII bacterium]|jgi:hypothetical protein|nr:fibronectin type III domain-containing protein [Clostridiales Family XIII bacterium]
MNIPMTGVDAGPYKLTIFSEQINDVNNTDFCSATPYVYPSTIAVSTNTKPGKPTNLSTTLNDKKVTLSWAAPSSDGGSAITGYEVQKNSDSGWASVETNTSHEFTGLNNGPTYTSYVRAVNEAGGGVEASRIYCRSARSKSYADSASMVWPGR